MVKNNSAQLCWPSEHRVPVDRNHTDMVKFCSSEDATYRTVVTHMAGYVNNLATSRGMRQMAPILEISGLINIWAANKLEQRTAILNRT